MVVVFIQKFELYVNLIFWFNYCVSFQHYLV